MPMEPALREIGQSLAAATVVLSSQEMTAREARRRAVMRANAYGMLDEAAQTWSEPSRSVSWGGQELAVSITAAGPSDGPRVLYLHSGGWVTGSAAATARACRALAVGLGGTVVSLDYPLAPEAPYPAALENTLAALRWLASDEAELPGDPGKLILVGESAGGNLAAAALLRLRDGGDHLPLRAAVLIVPVLDCDFTRASYQRYDKGDIDGRSGMHWYGQQYLDGNEITPAELPYVWPLRSERLDQLPPMILVQAQYDPLVDEHLEWVSRVRADGGQIELLHYDGVGHSFFGLDHLSPASRQAQQQTCAALAAILDQPEQSTP